MGDIKDQMAAKVQAAARGYIQRKTGMGGKPAGKKHKGGKAGKGGKKAKKSEDMNAMIIQAAFKKYKEHQNKN